MKLLLTAHPRGIYLPVLPLLPEKLKVRPTLYPTNYDYPYSSNSLPHPLLVPQYLFTSPSFRHIPRAHPLPIPTTPSLSPPPPYPYSFSQSYRSTMSENWAPGPGLCPTGQVPRLRVTAVTCSGRAAPGGSPATPGPRPGIRSTQSLQCDGHRPAARTVASRVGLAGDS